MRTWPRKLPVLLGAILAVALFVIQGVFFLRANSQTFDEATHLTAGYSYLATGDFRINVEHPPLIKELCALAVWLRYHLPFEPEAHDWQVAKDGEEIDGQRIGQDRAQWAISRDFLYRSPVSADSILTAARIPNLVLGCFVVLLVGWWAYRLWGEAAALLGMAITALEPNLVAHSCLVTTDTGMTLFTLLTLYLLWEYVLTPSGLRLVGVGVALGLALATKFSAVLLVGIVGLLLGVFACMGQENQSAIAIKARLGSALTSFLRITCLGLLLILPFYFFRDFFGTWVEGLKTVFKSQETGRSSFFMGQFSSGGWWNYFLSAILIKTPIGTLVLVAASLLFCWAGKPLGRREAIFLLTPIIVLVAALSRSGFNLGLRHVLPIYPFLFLLAARLATIRIGPAWVTALLVSIPLGASAFSSLRVAPHQLAYFNEWVGGPEEGYHYLSDSNLDWGQDLRNLKNYLDRNELPMVYLSYFGTAPPEVFGIHRQYLPSYGYLDRPPLEALPATIQRELLAISVTNLQGAHLPEKDVFHWLLGRQPIAKIGYSIYVYDLTGDGDAHLQLAKTYLRLGPRELAKPELRRALALDPGNAEAARLSESLR